MSGGVQGPHHVLELGDLPTRHSGPNGGRILRMGSEESDGVVPPVICQAAFDQKRLRHAVVNGQQFDCRYTEVLEVVDGARGGHPGVGTADLGGDVRVLFGESFDVDS